MIFARYHTKYYATPRLYIQMLSSLFDFDNYSGKMFHPIHFRTHHPLGMLTSSSANDIPFPLPATNILHSTVEQPHNPFVLRIQSNTPFPFETPGMKSTRLQYEKLREKYRVMQADAVKGAYERTLNAHQRKEDDTNISDSTTIPLETDDGTSDNSVGRSHMSTQFYSYSDQDGHKTETSRSHSTDTKKDVDGRTTSEEKDVHRETVDGKVVVDKHSHTRKGPDGKVVNIIDDGLPSPTSQTESSEPTRRRSSSQRRTSSRASRSSSRSDNHTVRRRSSSTNTDKPKHTPTKKANKNGTVTKPKTKTNASTK